MTRKYLQILALLFASLSLSAQNDKTFEVLKNLEIFSSTYKQLHLFYVDETQPGKLMKTAIDAMLQSLDPYTVYIPEANIEDVRIMTEGQYDGIGSLIMKRDGATYISEIYENFPAYKAGLMVGDKILKINDIDIKDKDSDEVSTLLKGQTNTSLTLLIERKGEPKPIEKHLVRESIKFKNVTYSKMFPDQVGYIRLDGFTEGASEELKQTLIRLKEEGADKLIIDLRGNGGGLMNEAVSIVELFVKKGLPVVSMKGKVEDRNQTFYTQKEPLDTEIPIVVMIDRASASAAEIVAGALQDYDRAVIMGQRSFGKGLVQNILPLDYNSQLKITTAKYYIPSGRCVQAIDYGNRDEEGHAYKLPDSLRTAFKTLNGSFVYFSDDIEPDIELPTEIFGNITVNLLARLHFYDFANDFRRKHASIVPAGEFIVDDKIFDEFKAYLNQTDFDYHTETEDLVTILEQSAELEGYLDAIKDNIEDLKVRLQHDKNIDIDKHKKEIQFILGSEIVGRYYYQTGVTEYSLVGDEELKKAMDLLGKPDEIKTILK